MRTDDAKDLHAFFLAREEKRQADRKFMPGALSAYRAPKKVGRRSHYAIEKEACYVFHCVDLDLARARAVELDNVVAIGVRSHFHYEAPAIGLLGRRWSGLPIRAIAAQI